MILLCGIPSETPIELVRSRLDELNEPYLSFNQRRFRDLSIELEISNGEVGGLLRIDGEAHPLGEFGGVYTRLMDYRRLPEFRDRPTDREHCRVLHETLNRWLEIAPGRVVNRSGPQASNFSKPYQSQLIRAQGFAIPETLITNRPELVHEFRARHKRLVFKSISGLRSIVRTLEPADLAQLDRIRWCPVQFQQYIDGANIRVHTVAEMAIATAIATDATDYRYAHRDDRSAILRPIQLSDELAARCLRLAASLQLPVAGIDLKVTPAGEAYCLEVNPSPAFSYYELEAGQPISLALARYLTGD
jgi:hypothetical protein